MRMYFVHVKGKQYGPYDEAKVRSLNLPPDTPIWTEGMPNWAPMSQVLPMGSNPRPMQSPQPQPLSQPVQPQPTQQARPVQQQPVQQAQQQTQQQAQQTVQQPTQQAYTQQPEYLSLWGYYKKCWRKYATFSGRARRSEYWGFVLYNFLILLAINILVALAVALIVMASSDKEAGFFAALFAAPIALIVVTSIYNLAVIIPGLAVSSRRLHDTGRSFWWFLLVLTSIIPIIGIIGPIVLIVFYFMDSEPFENRFGPNPKAFA